MADTRSNMKLADLNSKPHGVQSLIYLIDLVIRAYFYPPPGSDHYKLLCVDNFHEPNQRQVNLHNKSVKNELYDVLHHDFVGGVYHSLFRKKLGKHNSRSNSYVQNTRPHEKITRVPASISYNYI